MKRLLMSSRLPLGTSYDRDATVILRYQDDNRSDSDQVEEAENYY